METSRSLAHSRNAYYAPDPEAPPVTTETQALRPAGPVLLREQTKSKEKGNVTQCHLIVTGEGGHGATTGQGALGRPLQEET